jgi:polyisoprenoid-binding protein YceI
METSKETTTATQWVLDPSHSELGFKVKHLMISNVKGAFTRFSAVVDGEDFTKSTIALTIDSSSVTTFDEGRDGHLRAADFFDVEHHPEIKFTSTSFKQEDGDDYKLQGLLTIKDVTHPVTLDVEFGGINTDPWGNRKAGFSVSGKINRKDWGLNWNSALETGGVLVSDEVKITAEVQLVKK